MNLQSLRPNWAKVYLENVLEINLRAKTLNVARLKTKKSFLCQNLRLDIIMKPEFGPNQFSKGKFSARILVLARMKTIRSFMSQNPRLEV